MFKHSHWDISDAIDITRTLGIETPTYPGDPEVHLERMDAGSTNITKITLCTHSGTHLDAPSHYIPDGDNIGDVPLDRINGAVSVIDLSGINREIMPSDLSNGHENRILIKTDYSEIKVFYKSYSALSAKCAEYLVNSGIQCIGIDAPSIEPFEGDGTVHRILLSAKIAIIELLDLSRVEEGRYIMNALPLPLEDCDGAPIRALLYKSNEEDK